MRRHLGGNGRGYTIPPKYLNFCVDIEDGLFPLYTRNEIDSAVVGWCYSAEYMIENCYFTPTVRFIIIMMYSKAIVLTKLNCKYIRYELAIGAQ